MINRAMHLGAADQEVSEEGCVSKNSRQHVPKYQPHVRHKQVQSVCSYACTLCLAACCHADVLEWTWFLNAFSKGHLYEFMYGDKDTYSVAFGLANKAHMYQHMNMPPGEGS
jgi:hypothetical protein